MWGVSMSNTNKSIKKSWDFTKKNWEADTTLKEFVDLSVQLHGYEAVKYNIKTTTIETFYLCIGN